MKQKRRKTRSTLGEQHLAYWRRHLDEWHLGFIYVMRIGKRGSVKVGYAENPTGRMKTFQTAVPGEFRLLLVAPGDQRLEHALHKRFAEHRVRGEWFGGDGVAQIIGFVTELATEMIQAHDENHSHPPRWELSPHWSDEERKDFKVIHSRAVFDDQPIREMSEEELAAIRAELAARPPRQPSFVRPIGDSYRRQRLTPVPSPRNVAPLSQ